MKTGHSKDLYIPHSIIHDRGDKEKIALFTIEEIRKKN